MFNRFKQNIRTYPRTAAMVGCLYLGAILGSIITGVAMHLSTVRELTTLASLIGLVAFADLLIYLWVTADPTRLRILLEALDNFEGREREEASDADLAAASMEEGYYDEEEFESEEDAEATADYYEDERGQDIAEYAVMLAVILAIALGTMRLIGSNASNVFSQVGSTITSAE